jgi:hypothetical protein
LQLELLNLSLRLINNRLYFRHRFDDLRTRSGIKGFKFYILGLQFLGLFLNGFDLS